MIYYTLNIEYTGSIHEDAVIYSCKDRQALDETQHALNQRGKDYMKILGWIGGTFKECWHKHEGSREEAQQWADDQPFPVVLATPGIYKKSTQRWVSNHNRSWIWPDVEILTPVYGEWGNNE